MSSAKQKIKIPKFRTESEEAEYWGTHDTTDIWKHAKPARTVKLPPAQIKMIRERHDQRKTAISIRLDPEQIKVAKKIAARKSIGYQTQLRMWIADGIRREA